MAADGVRAVPRLVATGSSPGKIANRIIKHSPDRRRACRRARALGQTGPARALRDGAHGLLRLGVGRADGIAERVAAHRHALDAYRLDIGNPDEAQNAAQIRLLEVERL